MLQSNLSFKGLGQTLILSFTMSVGIVVHAYTNEYLPRTVLIQRHKSFEAQVEAEKKEESAHEGASRKDSDTDSGERVPDQSSYVWRVEGYRPNYFIYGNPDAKVSVSLKVPLLNTSNLYLGYSQLMFWELSKKSTPFRDINYNPEIFYRQYFSNDSSHWLDYGIYEHESNGRDGLDSRSWERHYLRYVKEFEQGPRDYILSVKSWVNFIKDPGNKDIKNYRGIYEVNFTIKNIFNMTNGTSDLNLRVYGGGPSWVDPTRGGQELTLRASMPYFKRFRPLLVAQVFNGYGEGLLDYKTRHTVGRLGISF